MKILKLLLVIITLVVGMNFAFAQSVDDLNNTAPSGEVAGSGTDNGPTDGQEPNLPNLKPPAWETREGVEAHVKASAQSYFQAKAEYVSCRCKGDRAGMARAAKKMRTHSSALAAYKKQQAKRDAAQDKRLDAHSGLVWKHESQINGRNGINDRLTKNEKAVKTLNDEMDSVAPAIAGITAKFDGLTWWVLALTIIVVIGFTRRFWITR